MIKKRQRQRKSKKQFVVFLFCNKRKSVYAGTNGNFKYTSTCYYTDSTDCATIRSALIEVENPGQTSLCSIGGSITPVS